MGLAAAELLPSDPVAQSKEPAGFRAPTRDSPACPSCRSLLSPQAFGIITAGLLAGSNIFMTFAGYGKLTFKSTALATVILIGPGDQVF